jgi:hypothetical protein
MLESLVQILRQPGWQRSHRDGHATADLAIDLDGTAARAPGLDLIGQRQNDRGAVQQPGRLRSSGGASDTSA